MSNADYVLGNQSGASFRAELNTILEAVVSNNSSSSEPSVMFAYMWWADTTAGLLKQRNSANNAWISHGVLATANLGHAVLADAQTFTGAQRGEITALTDASSIATDLALSNNFAITLGGNRTLANPSNITAGQSGSIFITQDGTGSRTLAYGSYFKFVAGTAPVLSTTAAAIDRIDYVVKSSTAIHAVASLDVK
jgi:hypothetical protein|tara:strand:+ start:417 stop:1001 length:585 start_codon:yes stop_codon:yes gene_type:complete